LEINNKFDIGEPVYLRTDPDQYTRMVIGIYVEDNNITYCLGFLSDVSYHQSIEISREKDVLKKIE